METLKSLLPHHNSPDVKGNVILLRTPTGSDDRYETAFRDRGYNPLSVAVLETTYTNLEHLKHIITEGPGKRGYVGVVITSQRSCEAWKSVVLALVGADPEAEQDKSADWESVPFYVVGEATARSLSNMGEVVGGYPYTPRDIRGAGESGTSEKLARFILKDLPSPLEVGKWLLYLTGDKNRDTLPSILNEGGVKLDTLQAYETHGSSTLKADLEKALQSVPSNKGSNRWWVTYFAPSDADFATPVLRDYFSLPSSSSSPPTTLAAPTPRIAAIGPTSASHLREQLSLRVAVVSPKPNADALAGAISEYDVANP